MGDFFTIGNQVNQPKVVKKFGPGEYDNDTLVRTIEASDGTFYEIYWSWYQLTNDLFEQLGQIVWTNISTIWISRKKLIMATMGLKSVKQGSRLDNAFRKRALPDGAKYNHKLESDDGLFRRYYSDNERFEEYVADKLEKSGMNVYS